MYKLNGLWNLKLKKIISFLIGLLFTTSYAFSFNWEKCRNMDKGVWRLVGFFSPFTMSTQFTSSWGECSAIGLNEIKKNFMNNNKDLILTDIAKGGGEYLVALGRLCGKKITHKHGLNMIKTNTVTCE